MRPTLALALTAAAACTPKPADPPTPWAPGTVYPTERQPNARGYLDRRGLIHAHSHYSHDACDGQPRDDAGVYDEPCLDDFRDGLCKSQHDFVFLTDHRDSFDEAEFPDVLLYRPAKGDALITHDGNPTANRLSCPSQTEKPIILAGNETNMMPVGLERHADGRGSTYGDESDAGIAKIHAAGGLAIVAHTENWSADQLSSIGFDGFEMYNLHANSLKNLAIAADWAFKADAQMFDGLPDPNLFLIGFNLEDPRYLDTWGATLAKGVKRVTTMGTDCHRNTLPQKAQDGERIDSYRRMMTMFSNHLLVKPNPDGSIDDRALKDALANGRLYGSFDFMGYPVGFDFTSSDGAEMGGDSSTGSTLTATMPSIQRLDPNAEAPTLTLHLLRATPTGWEQVATTSEKTLSHTATTPGAYRVEVRIVPKHLKGPVGKNQTLTRAERPWVYSNPIYVR